MRGGLLVSEVFGPTLQGEGPLTGRPAMFVRLGLCNLSCSWCDTPYTWDWSRFDRREELRRQDVDSIVSSLTDLADPLPGLVVLTGGEPLVQQKRLPQLVTALREVGAEVQVETNGTIPPSAELFETVAAWSVSPKLRHADNPTDPRLSLAVADTLRVFRASGRDVAYKFVAQHPSDLDEVGEWVDRYDLPGSSVWVMAEGTTRESQVRPDLAEATIQRGWNYTPRLHVTLWGDERGR